MSGERNRRSPLDADVESALTSAIAPVELPSEQRSRMRSRILERVAAGDAGPGLSTLRAHEGEWQPLGPGVVMKVLRTDRVARRWSFLVRMEPGSAAPSHTHTQVEECLVLEGEVWVGEEAFHAGDWHVAQPGSEHRDFRTKTGCLLFLSSEMPS
jgi:anti-sigma factor ChrR (cupin superfamily)